MATSSTGCLGCKQLTALSKTAKSVPVLFAHTCTLHTAISPGADSHVLLSTRWGRFTSLDDARRAVAQLSLEERVHLEKAVKDINKLNEEKLVSETEPPSWNQLKLRKMNFEIIVRNHDNDH